MVDIVVIGAGPYGLSIAAHLRQTRLSFRVFGRPMMLWRDTVPKGMLLNSDGFATSLAAPGAGFPLERFYRDAGRTDYSHTGLHIPVEILTEYGLEFQRRCVGSVDEAKIISVRKEANGFDVVLDTGEQLFTWKVVVAVGPLGFKNVPRTLETLSGMRVLHSADLHDPGTFRGRRVAVVGGGQSALESAVLLHERGARVTILPRRPLLWPDPARLSPRHSGQSARQGILWPNLALGPKLRTWLWSEAPYAFRHLPAGMRNAWVHAGVGPAILRGLRRRVDGVIPVECGHIVHASEKGGEIVLNVQGPDGHATFAADHVVAATGYKTDIRRLAFLDGLSGEVRTVGGAPVLNRQFESSVPGLLFAGHASSASFGPSMRFIYGARFAAVQIARSLSDLVATRSFAGGFTTHETA